MGHSDKPKPSGFLREWMDSGALEPETPKQAKLRERVAKLRERVQRLDAEVKVSAHKLIQHGTAAVIANAKVSKGFRRNNARRKTESTARAKDLQRKAAAKWAQPQHAGKSASEIARLIDPAHWTTTRRKIKRP